jgi:hypothetical protein
MTFARTLLAVILTMALGMVHRATAQDDNAAAPTTRPSTQSSSGPIDFEKLKAVLPAELGGMKRSELTGEKSSAAGISFSMARAVYAKDPDKADGPGIDVHIQDYGTNKLLLDGMTGWTKTKLDQDGDDGFQKSTTIQDQPAVLRYLKEARMGSIELFVGGRFLMTVTTSNLSTDEFRKLADQLNLKELMALK